MIADLLVPDHPPADAPAEGSTRPRSPGSRRATRWSPRGGLVGKVVKVDDHYAEIEIAQGVKVKAVKSTIGDVIAARPAPPAND